MTYPQAWNVAGIALATLGVIGLFFFGAPFRVRGRGRSITWTSSRPHLAEEAKDGLFDLFGWLSLVVTVSGAACQVVATLL